MVLERFHVLELLTFSTNEEHAKMRFVERDKQVPMIESALTFICHVIAMRNQLGWCSILIFELRAYTVYGMYDSCSFSLVCPQLVEVCTLWQN